MRKQDLKQGWIVQTKGGSFYFVSGNQIIGNGWMSLIGYREDMRYPKDDFYDIVKVYSAENNFIKLGFDLTNKSVNYLTLVWERKDLPKLTPDEIVILNALDDGYRYIIRDGYGRLQLNNSSTITQDGTTLYAFNNIFDGIKANETYSIQELLDANKGE